MKHDESITNRTFSANFCNLLFDNNNYMYFIEKSQFDIF